MLATDPPAGDYPSADFNGDGDVDMLDFQIFSLAVGQSGGVEYVWNHENRLIEVVPLAPTTSGDKKVVFSYDAFGRRIRKQVFPWNDATSTWGSAESDTKFLYDGWRVVMEFDGLNSDAITRKHTWGLDLSGSMEGAGGIGGLLATEDTAGTATTTDDRTFIYFYDANGNVGQLIETTSGANYGAIAAHYEYSPYGERTNTPAVGEYDQPFRFSTKWFDDETGLGNWGYRHYDPTTGRWMSRDPIGESGGFNLYAYVGNGPIGMVDGIGLLKLQDCPDGWTLLYGTGTMSHVFEVQGPPAHDHKYPMTFRIPITLNYVWQLCYKCVGNNVAVTPPSLSYENAILWHPLKDFSIFGMIGSSVYLDMASTTVTNTCDGTQGTRATVNMTISYKHKATLGFVPSLIGVSLHPGWSWKIYDNVHKVENVSVSIDNCCCGSIW